MQCNFPISLIFNIKQNEKYVHMLEMIARWAISCLILTVTIIAYTIYIIMIISFFILYFFFPFYLLLLLFVLTFYYTIPMMHFSMRCKLAIYFHTIAPYPPGLRDYQVYTNTIYGW